MSSGGGKDAGSIDAAIAKAGDGKVEIKKIEESKNIAQTSAGKARALMALAPTSAPVTGGTEPTGLIQVKGATADSTSMTSVEEAKKKLEDILKQESDKTTDPGTFLTNVVKEIKDVFLDMWNIVVVSGWEHDEWWSGQSGPVSGIKAETTTFRAYIFETGQYIRFGKLDDSAWRHYEETNFKDEPFTKSQHAEFNTARSKVLKYTPTLKDELGGSGEGPVLGNLGQPVKGSGLIFGGPGGASGLAVH